MKAEEPGGRWKCLDPGKLGESRRGKNGVEWSKDIFAKFQMYFLGFPEFEGSGRLVDQVGELEGSGRFRWFRKLGGGWWRTLNFLELEGSGRLKWLKKVEVSGSWKFERWKEEMGGHLDLPYIYIFIYCLLFWPLKGLVAGSIKSS